MNSEERKKRFAVLMLEIVEQSGGVKSQLAQKLGITPSTLTVWCQAKVDPASLEISLFNRIAAVKGCSVDELAKLFTLKSDVSKTPLQKLRVLIREMLGDKSQEQLAQKLAISKNTIRGWLNPTKNPDPSLISTGTIANLADEKEWTIEQLLAYLNIKNSKEIEEDILILIQSKTKQLSFFSRIKLLSWLSGDFEKDFSNLNLGIINTKEDRSQVHNYKILIVLEQENNTIASNYFSNLVEYLKFQAKNIKIATIPKLPQSLADIDILIFDINTADSPSIQLIEDLTFNGHIIIFGDAIALPLIRDKISSAVSEIFVKPVDWSAKQLFSLFSK